MHPLSKAALLQHTEHPLHPHLRLADTLVEEHHDEFIAAQAEDKVVSFQIFADALCHKDQQAVTLQMAVGVVDPLEPVDIIQ